MIFVIITNLFLLNIRFFFLLFFLVVSVIFERVLLSCTLQMESKTPFTFWYVHNYISICSIFPLLVNNLLIGYDFVYSNSFNINLFFFLLKSFLHKILWQASTEAPTTTMSMSRITNFLLK